MIGLLLVVISEEYSKLIVMIIIIYYLSSSAYGRIWEQHHPTIILTKHKSYRAIFGTFVKRVSANF